NLRWLHAITSCGQSQSIARHCAYTDIQLKFRDHWLAVALRSWDLAAEDPPVNLQSRRDLFNRETAYLTHLAGLQPPNCLFVELGQPGQLGQGQALVVQKPCKNGGLDVIVHSVIVSLRIIITHRS